MIDPWITEIARQRQQERLEDAERHRLLATGAARRGHAWAGGIRFRLRRPFDLRGVPDDDVRDELPAGPATA
jgi:hypothetical protein